MGPREEHIFFIGDKLIGDAIFIRYFLKCMELKQTFQKCLAPKPAGVGGVGGRRPRGLPWKTVSD